MSRGALIINADDWGRDRETTDKTLACRQVGAISSVSAMVFTADAERAAAIAREHDIDTGLHINLTMPFTAPNCSPRLREQQERIGRYLRCHRLAQAVYNPLLAGAFAYVVAAQREEFERLYGAAPARLDGHHHMHLCSNVVLGGLLPAGTLVRRNFSFQPGEKSIWNRAFRRWLDARLARRHRLADFFFSLPPLDPPERVKRIFSLAGEFTVEVETHPVNAGEYRFLTEGEIFRWAGSVPVASSYEAAGAAA